MCIRDRAYIGVLFMLFTVSILFASYNHSERSVAAFKIAFMLSLGSLFTPLLLLFVPLTWIALVIMRCFSFRSLDVYKRQVVGLRRGKTVRK